MKTISIRAEINIKVPDEYLEAGKEYEQVAALLEFLLSDTSEVERFKIVGFKVKS